MRDEQEDKDGNAICTLLLWCRAHGYRPSRVTVGLTSIDLEDLKTGIEPAAVVRGPRSVHEAFSMEYGVAVPDDEEDDEEQPS